MSNDLRYILRSLAKDRVFAATVILSLAVGIGATTAIFSVVDGVLLRPLDFPSPDRLVAVTQSSPKFLAGSVGLPINIAQLVEWRKQASSLEGIGAFRSGSFNFTGAGEPELVGGAVVSANLFRVLGVAPRLGRDFLDSEEMRGNDRIVMLSDGFWRRRFQADPNITQRSITLEGRAYRIAGVLPAGFEFPRMGETGPRLGDKLEIFRPLGYSADDMVFGMGDFNYWTVVRVRQGVAIARASAELNAIQNAMTVKVSPDGQLLETMRPLQEEMTARVRKGLIVILSAVSAVLLILCVNLANLSLGRAAGRARDAAIRTALGASSGQLMRQSFLESTVLCMTGGALGVLLAFWGLKALVAAAPLDIPRMADVRLDARVLLFALAVSALTSIVCGLLPAFRSAASRTPYETLKSGRAANSEGRKGAGLRNVLVGVEVALSATLLVTAGLLIFSFTHLMGMDRGFDVSRVISVRVPLPYAKYPKDEQKTQFFDRLLAQVETLPGVESVSLSSAVPLQGETWIDMVSRENDTRPSAQLPMANIRFISPNYFKTLRMPLLRGRDFEARDRGHRVAIISNSLAGRLYPGMDTTGHKVHDNGKDLEIVGITKDARSTSLDKDPVNMVYVPYWQRPQSGAALFVRTAMDPAGIASALRAAVWSIDNEVPVPEERTLEQVMERSVAQRRFQVDLMFLFAAAALLLAAFGTYGVVSYAVARRTNEIGIRMALGANQGNVLRMVLRQGMLPVFAGLAAGALAALWIGRSIGSLLFQVSPRDPVAFGAASTVLIVASALACLIPARRATQVNPIDALRIE